MAHITLVYDIASGLQNPTSLAAIVAAIPISQELAFLHMSVFSDATVALTQSVRRTVVLETNADSDAMFPTDSEKIAATRNLLSGVLGLPTPARVTTSAPVVS